MTFRSVFRGVGKALLVFAGCICFGMILLEMLYRLQLIDTYAPELRAYNSAADLADSPNEPTALLMGDSFTAGIGESYPSRLREMLPGVRIVNSAISGTGIVQTALVAKGRFARFHPQVFLYQVYVGNDLFDIRYPVSWGHGSFVRNAYWYAAEHLRSLAFVNYRLGQLAYQRRVAGTDMVDPRSIDRPFSPALYTPHARIYFAAEPGLVNQSVLLTGQRAEDFKILAERLRQLLMRCAPGHCKALILVIPHCAQVALSYLENTRALGATLDSAALAPSEYPFVARLRAGLNDLPNVTVLNPIDMLRATERSGVHVYHSNDDHLNAAGNRVIADFLAPFLSRSLDAR